MEQFPCVGTVNASYLELKIPSHEWPLSHPAWATAAAGLIKLPWVLFVFNQWPFFFRFLASESELELSDDSKRQEREKNITRKTLIGFEKHEKGRRCFFVVMKNGDGWIPFEELGCGGGGGGVRRECSPIEPENLSSIPSNKHKVSAFQLTQHDNWCVDQG